LGGIPSGTDHDDSPVITPDNGEVVDSGTVSEDQSSRVDDSGVVAEDDIAGIIANCHAWGKHVDDPTGDLFDSPKDLAETIQDIIEYPDDVRILKNGRKAWWNDSLGVVLIYDPASSDKGAVFKPKDGKD